MLFRKTISVSILTIMAAVWGPVSSAKVYEVYDAKVNAMTNPSGIQDSPVFQWRLASDRNGSAQTAYSIEVKDIDGKPVWKSGKIQSSKPFGVKYSGNALKSNTEYLWQVTSFDNAGNSATSQWQIFSTGIDKSEWVADWIEITEPRHVIEKNSNPFAAMFAGMGGDAKPYVPEEELDKSQYFRKEFKISRNVKRATAYATAHGIYNLYINGEIVSDLFAPEFTSYPNILEYQRYDITANIQKGANVVGAIVADGWWTGKLGVGGIGNQYGDTNGLLCQIIIEYTDGSSEIVKTDKDFKWSYGAYQFADIYEGEGYDANCELVGWTKAGYNDSSWNSVKVCDYGYDVLQGRHAEPVRVVRQVKPKALYTSPSGQTVLDVGENIVGWVESTLTGKKGQTVSFRHQEEVDSKGNVLMNFMTKNKEQLTKYTFAEDGTVTYIPQFTFMGFRYVVIEGLSEGATVDDFVVDVINTDMQIAGTFKTSDSRFNQLQENILRSQSGNMLSIPTDCPHREKAGWTGDMQIYAPTGMYNMDMQSFLNKWLQGMRYDQKEDGYIPDVTPRMPDINQVCAAGWSDACVIVPWRMYEEYADVSVLEQNYAMMEKWMDYVADKSPEGVWGDGFQYGDWSLPKTPEKYAKQGGGGFMGFGVDLGTKTAATSMYAYSCGLMVKIAQVLGKSDDVKKYSDLLDKITNAYRAEFLKEDGRLNFDMQGLYTLALNFNLVDNERRPQMQQHLIESIHEMDDCLNTGFISTPFLLDVLTSFDKEMAHNILFNDRAPSWLYEVKMGATTMWESWMAIPEDHNSARASLNHFAYGCVGDYLYREVLGLKKGAPGYEKIIIDPVMMDGFDWVEGSHETPFGKVSVRWEKSAGKVNIDVTVPPGCSAVVKTPSGEKTLTSGKHRVSF